MKGGLLFIACAALLFFPITAKADCTLTSSGETRPTGTIIYNADFEVLQACKNDGTWKAMTPVTAGAPTGCPTIGDTCSDGTIYAGDSPDGNVPMYTTAADQSSGAYWGTYGYTTGDTSTVTGKANSADIYAHVQAGDGGYNPDDGYTPNALVLCEELTANGRSDWYLPAQDELDVLYTNKAAIGGFNVSGSFPAGYYWSSSENNNNLARYQRFSDGAQSNYIKYIEISVRCVRR